MEYITTDEWVKRYGNNGYDPEFINLEFGKTKGSTAFPIQSFVQMMLEVDSEDGLFLQPYYTESDKKCWALIRGFDHSTESELKCAKHLVISAHEYHKYSMYNWDREDLKSILKTLFPEQESDGSCFIVKSSTGKSCGRSNFTYQELEKIKNSGDYYVAYAIAESKALDKSTKMARDMLNECEHTEKPVRLWIGGCDDSSYAKCFATQKEALDIVDYWVQYGVSQELIYNKQTFSFTN
jgi:hypothetical protein